LKYKGCALALLALAMASFLLLHFAMIWAYGRFYIYESNPLVLLAETGMMVGILIFSSYCFVEYLRHER
jgi:hypothetical protein